MEQLEIKYDNICQLNGQFKILKVLDMNKVSSPEELNKIYQSVAIDGTVELVTNGLIEEDLNSIIKNLKFAGFIDVSVQGGIITASKKQWSKKKKENPWKSLKGTEKAEKKVVLIEDELIDPFDSYQKFSKEEDCITKPKPCKNCNCGRAEKEVQETSKMNDENFKPSCGKCYLGDAFRCAGCPFRGKPAFEPGDKIEFSNSEIIGEEIQQETSQINIKGNKIKLDI